MLNVFSENNFWICGLKKKHVKVFEAISKLLEKVSVVAIKKMLVKQLPF